MPMEQTPLLEDETHGTLESAQPTIHRNASWGAFITILVILAMVTIGALYEWGQRLDEERAYRAGYTIDSTTYTLATTTATTTPSSTH